jgi:hypothetical protein
MKKKGKGTESAERFFWACGSKKIKTKNAIN